jgi:hypothetical protein
LAGDRRLRDVEILRCPPEMLATGDRDEILEVAKLDHLVGGTVLAAVRGW